MAYRLGHGQFQWRVFLETFTTMHLGWLGAATSLVMLTYVGRALRWQVMLKPLKPNSSLWTLFDATAIGFTAMVLFGRPGEVVRPYLIAVKEEVPFSSQLAAWLLERIYDLLLVLVLFGYALTQIQSSSTKIGNELQWVFQAGGHTAGILGTICLGLLVAFGLFPNIVEKRLTQALQVLPDIYAKRLQTLVSDFVSGTRSTTSRSAVLLLVVYTVVEWMLIVACFWCIFQAFPATASLGILDTVIVVGFVAFGSVLTIPGIGGGMQLVTVLVLTQLFQVPVEMAGGIAILIWVITFGVVVPLGLMLAFREGLKWRKLLQDSKLDKV